MNLAMWHDIRATGVTTAHVFIATSLEGYIARADGDIDWLLQRDDGAEDHGYGAFSADKEMIVMGRGCYEKTLTFDGWPYALPVLVMSRQLAGTPVPAALAGKVRFSGQTPKAVMQALAEQGVRRVYLDGGQLVHSTYQVVA